MSDFEDICKRIQRFADLKYPGHQGGQVKITLANRRKLVLPIQSAVQEAVPTNVDEQLNEPQREIRQVFEEAETAAVLSVRDIAHLTGQEENSRLRDNLAALVRLKVVVNVRGEGYRLC